MPIKLSNSELIQLIQPILEPGEKLIWLEQPDPKRFWSEIAALVFLGLLFSGAAIGLLVIMWSSGLWFSFLMVIEIIFLVLGILNLAAPWRLRRRLRKTVYALTDRRASILRGVGWTRQDMIPDLSEQLYSFGPPELCQRTLKRRSGRRIDIVFGTETHRIGRGKTMLVDIGFMGLSDSGPVEKMLEQRFSGHPIPHS